MNKKLIIGLGTGRCGTVSLYRLLNFQKNSFFTHESKPLLPWKFNQKKIDGKLKTYLNKNKKYVGEVNLSFLPYVEYIIEKYPFAKFIVLKRPKKDVIKSILTFTGLSNYNHWIEHDGKKWRKGGKWDTMFPKYHTDSKEKAIGLYWEDYHNQVGKLLKKYPKNILLFKTEDLNSNVKVKEILDFCGIEKRDQIMRANIKENKGRGLIRLAKYFFWRADKIN
jgi:hypothetical protein